MRYIFTGLICFFVLITQAAYAQNRSIVAIDTPTAYTITRGTYTISLLGYDNGGMELKTIIGLNDNFYLGASFDIQNAIGYDDPRPNVPGVIARLKIIEGIGEFPTAVAIGYDSFYIGQQGKRNNSSNDLNRVIYGPFLAFTSPIYLFDNEQYVSYGLRIPAQPDYIPEDTSYFLGLDVPLGLSFRIKGEIERVYYDLRDPDEWLFNFGIRYSYLDDLGIEVDFLYQPDHLINRIIRIEYHGEF